MTRLASFDPTLASAVLASAGLKHRSADLTAEARDGRWLVRLPARKLAWFAASETGLAQLRIERRVLRLLEARCSFSAPRVLYESPDGEFDVRSMVPGTNEAFSVYAEVRNRPELAATMGHMVARCSPSSTHASEPLTLHSGFRVGQRGPNGSSGSANVSRRSSTTGNWSRAPRLS